MLNAKIRNISYRDPHPSDRYKKARPVQQTKPYFGGIEKYLDARPPLTSIPGILSHKADGCTGELRYTKGFVKSDDTLDLSYRTPSGEGLMNLPHPERYLRKEALDRDARPNLEMCAMLHGKRELGHYYVEAAVAAFIKNGYTNKGPLHLHLNIFGLHTIQTGGEERTPELPPLKLMEELLVPGNGLLFVVPFREYSITKYRNEMLFRDKSGAVVAADYDRFCKVMLAETHKDGKEGWVFSVPNNVFRGIGASPNEPDGFGTERDRAALKIKPEFNGQYVALKVDRVTEAEETTEIWLYGRTDAGKPGLRYVANVTGHEVIESLMRLKAASMTYANDEEKKRLYRLDFCEACGTGAGVQIRATSANVTRNGFLLGVKKYGTKSVPLDFDEVTDALKMAKENAHFVSTKQAQEDLKREMADLEDEEAQLNKAWKNKARKPAPAPLKRAASPDDTQSEDGASPAKTPKLLLDPLEQETEAFKRAIDGPRYRVLDPAPVVYVNDKGWLGPMKLFFLRKWIYFLGGNPVKQPGPDVTIVIDHPKSLCTCADIQPQCHPTVRFITKEDLPALLRTGR